MTTRNVALNEMNMRGISINADTTANIVTIAVAASDSGIIFINKEVNADVTYNLPVVADGKGKFWYFYNGQTTNNIIVNSGTQNVFVGNDSAVRNKFTANSGLIGDAAMVFGDGDFYYLIQMKGDWTGT